MSTQVEANLKSSSEFNTTMKQSHDTQHIKNIQSTHDLIPQSIHTRN